MRRGPDRRTVRSTSYLPGGPGDGERGRAHGRHGTRPGDPGRPGGRRPGRRAGGGRRGGRRRPRSPPSGRSPGAGAEEIDAAGLLVTPGFVDIHTHYDGQATWDSRHHPEQLARRHHGGHGQLRRGLRARAARRPRPAHLAHGGRRGHPRRRARRGDRVDVGELRRVPRRGRAAAPRHRPVRAAPPRGAAPLRHGRAGRPPGGGDGGGRGGHARAGHRGHAGGRHRLLDVAHPEPPHGDGRPDAVAAGRRGRARGDRAAAWPTPGTAWWS